MLKRELYIMPHSYDGDYPRVVWPRWKMAVSFFFMWFIWVTIVLSWLTAITAIGWWLASRLPV